MNPFEAFRKGAESRKKQVRSKAMFQRKGEKKRELPAGYNVEDGMIYTVTPNPNDLYNMEVGDGVNPRISMIEPDLDYYQKEAAKKILANNRKKLVAKNNEISKAVYKQKVKDGDITTPFQGAVNKLSYNSSHFMDGVKKDIQKAFMERPDDSSCTVSGGTISPGCMNDGAGGSKAIKRRSGKN